MEIRGTEWFDTDGYVFKKAREKETFVSARLGTLLFAAPIALFLR